ncbi:MAG TPA: CAP domain-containing protein [Solirubrobacterales bacterium]|nr:CAP domain-containing protein [Solirubrobacterales bacterium]
MTRKFPITQGFLTVLAIVVLLGLAVSSSAFGRASLSGQRVVSSTAHTATTASTLIAPVATCPGQTSLEAPAAVQEEAMRCMTDFARAGSGLAPLRDNAQLDGSAEAKASDLLRCDSFSHFACGREFTYWIEQSGYLGEGCWRAGENLAWGAGEFATVRSLFEAWLDSPGHRANILGEYTEMGLALEQGNLEGHRGAHVWAAHFGSHCES